MELWGLSQSMHDTRGEEDNQSISVCGKMEMSTVIGKFSDAHNTEMADLIDWNANKCNYSRFFFLEGIIHV